MKQQASIALSIALIVYSLCVGCAFFWVAVVTDSIPSIPESVQNAGMALILAQSGVDLTSIFKNKDPSGK